MIMKLGMEHYVLKLYKVYINDDPELTLAYFETMLNLFCTYSRPRSGERLQGHWSSGIIICDNFQATRMQGYSSLQ